MFKFTKIQSNESGVFNNNARLLNFDISGDMVMNPSQSFIQLACHIETATSQVHNMVLSSATEELNLENVGLIRNCWLMSSTKGKVEDIRRINKYSVNMKELRRGASEKNSSINSLYNAREYDNGVIISSPFVQMYKEGSTLSSYREALLRIPLSDLFFIGELQALDISSMGTLTLHLEFEDFDYLSLREVKMFRNPPTASENLIKDVTGAPTNVIITNFNTKLDNLEQSPYFVGQNITLTYTTDGGSTTLTQNVRINEIKPYNTVDGGVTTVTGNLQLTVSATVPLATSITVAEQSNPDGTARVVFDRADIVVCQLMAPQKQMAKEINYMTLETEEYTVNSDQLAKIFELPSNCVNAYLMFDSNDSNLISNNLKVRSYRMRLNNVDVYPYDIITNTQGQFGGTGDFPGIVFQDNLHLDGLNRTMLNSGYVLKNTSLVAMTRTTTAPQNNLTMNGRFAGEKLQILVLGTPTPLTVSPKLLQFTVRTVDATQTNIKTVIVYKMVMKTLML
jgi:hypothetical protein